MSYATAFEELDAVREEWLGLLTPPRARDVFRRPRWQEVWLDVFGRRADARFLTVRDAGRLVGLASLLDEGERVTFLGDHNICDYMDFVWARGQEDGVVTAIVERLFAEGRREIALWGLREGSPTASLLSRLANECGWDAALEDEATCPQLDLPTDWDGFLESLSGKNRHELRRKMRRFETTVGEMEMRVLCTPAEVASGMDDFLRLMTLKSDKAQFMTPTMERFFRRIGPALAEEGLAGLYVFELGGEPVASVFCFEDTQETLLYNSGFDPRYSHVAVGLISKASVLRHAIEDGRRRLDFLRGNEPYKYDLGARDSQVYRCLIKRA